MNGFTVCLSCRHRVQTTPGFCMVCGAVFEKTVILRQVAAKESQCALEMEWYNRMIGREYKTIAERYLDWKANSRRPERIAA